MACPGAGHGDAAGDGDVSVALSPAIGDGGVGAPSPAAPTVPFLPGTDDVEDARRRYADVVVEACRQRTLIEATLLDKKYRWPANRRLHGVAWHGAQSGTGQHIVMFLVTSLILVFPQTPPQSAPFLTEPDDILWHFTLPLQVPKGHVVPDVGSGDVCKVPVQLAAICRPVQQQTGLWLSHLCLCGFEPLHVANATLDGESRASLLFPLQVHCAREEGRGITRQQLNRGARRAEVRPERRLEDCRKLRRESNYKHSRRRLDAALLQL
jgi:hypothetical protein